MDVFKGFEKAVLSILLKNTFTVEVIESIQNEAEFSSYDYTGCGYFLSVRHAVFPSGRQVCDTPIVIGEYNDITCGFVVFLEDGELTLECHSWSETEVPANFRDQPVKIKPVTIESGRFVTLRKE